MLLDYEPSAEAFYLPPEHHTADPRSPKVGNDENYQQMLRRELLGSTGPFICRLPTSNEEPNAQTALREQLFPVDFITTHNTGHFAFKKIVRKINKTPYKVLDAPQLQDDFYLNLVDWSSSNTLAVGLSQSVYLWSACTSRVSRLCDLPGDETVTSVAWASRGQYLAVGTSKGEVLLYDVSEGRSIRTFLGHQSRVGSLAWNTNDALATGSRDHNIFLRDHRSQQHSVSRLVAHKQEVCGLKWSFDDSQLASGGNDNKLYIWAVNGGTGGQGGPHAGVATRNPLLKFTGHQAAVKAIGWSPHQHGILASGGGTADRSIRFWNTVTNSALNVVDTGSQVCNLVWSKTANELVSTHGYSLNQIIVWKYPQMNKIATLTGHTYRVLYLAMSPDGQSIVTGAGDETLRFWNVFPGSVGGSGHSNALMPQGSLGISLVIR